jgi:acetyltransferase
MNQPPDPKWKNVSDSLAAALGQGRRNLLEHEIYEILRIAGFRVPRIRFVSNEREIAGLDPEAVPGAEVVCKLISPGMPHRSEYGGIRFAKGTPEALTAVYRDFERIARAERLEFSGMLVAERIAGKDCVPHQLLLSLRQDPSFGPVVFCGLGGVGSEVY